MAYYFLDPYVLIFFSANPKTHRVKTGIQKATLNPIWNYTQEFASDFSSEIKFQIWDHDFLSRDDYMGTVVIPLASVPWDTPQELFHTVTKEANQKIAKVSGQLCITILKKSQYYGQTTTTTTTSVVQPPPLQTYASAPAGLQTGFAYPNHQVPAQPQPQVGLQAPGQGLKFFQYTNVAVSSGPNPMGRDYILIVDKSGSMAGSLWRQAHEAVSILAPHVVRADPDGITLFFFSGGSHFPKFENLKDEKQVEAAFNKEKPGGTTNLAGVLHAAFLETARTLKQTGRPSTILVITDGEPDDRRAVEKTIKEASNNLNRDEDLSLSFIQIGSDSAASRFLKHLDDELKCKFDIVDTMTAERMKGMSFADFIKLSIGD